MSQKNIADIAIRLESSPRDQGIRVVNFVHTVFGYGTRRARVACAEFKSWERTTRSFNFRSSHQQAFGTEMMVEVPEIPTNDPPTNMEPENGSVEDRLDEGDEGSSTVEQ